MPVWSAFANRRMHEGLFCVSAYSRHVYEAEARRASRFANNAPVSRTNSDFTYSAALSVRQFC